MKLNDIYLNAIKLLNENNIENSNFEAKELIKHYLKFNETEFLLNRFSDYADELIAAVNDGLMRRVKGEPIQYIIGEWDFMGNTYKVGKGVLIPRPETELLCELVREELNGISKPVIYDLCSGSGCIAVTLKLMRPDSDVYAVEKSPEAFSYLKINNASLCKNAPVKAVNGDIFDIESFSSFPLADVIVSNPPYIKKCDIAGLQAEVLSEPVMALDGGVDGLDFYRYIIFEWKSKLSNCGVFAFECGEDQSVEISALLNENGFDSTTVKDYNDINRIVIGRRRA